MNEHNAFHGLTDRQGLKQEMLETVFIYALIFQKVRLEILVRVHSWHRLEL